METDQTSSLTEISTLDSTDMETQMALVNTNGRTETPMQGNS